MGASAAKLRMYTNGYDTVIASSHDDAEQAWIECHGRVVRWPDGGLVTMATTTSADSIECPHCGYPETDISEHFCVRGTQSKTVECTSCEKPYKLTRVVSVAYFACTEIGESK